MKKEWILVPATCLTLLFSGWAEAQGNSRAKPGGTHLRINSAHAPVVASRRTARSVAPRSISNARRSAARSVPRLNTARGRSRAPSGFGRLNRNTAPANGGNALGGLLEQFLYNEYGGGRRYDPYAGEKAQARAYRDAAIANAVVNVVGILASAHQQRQYGVYATPPAPRGHVERQRILVHEGRIEEYQVWVPQYTIPDTGEVVIGHHETRRREIAPVYEEREVWIPSP